MTKTGSHLSVVCNHSVISRQSVAKYLDTAASRKLATATLVGIFLSGCVGANVDNSLDVAALGAPQDLSAQSLDQQALADTNPPSAPSSVPVPIRSPNTSVTALISPESQTEAAGAAEQVIVPTTQSAELVETPVASPTTAEVTAIQEPQTANASAVVRPVVPQQNISQPQKPKQTGGLLAFLFGNKKTSQVSDSTAAKSKTTVTSAPTKAELNGALPGVKRRSAIFGLNDDDDDNKGNIQLASVGAAGRLLSPSGLILQTERVQVDCFKPELLRILAAVERKYGKKVMVTSGYRSPNRNRRAGGVSNSTHIYCKAADIQVEGVSKWDLAKYLRTVPGRGGVGTYCRTKSVHIDVGTQRDWHHPCRRGKKRKKA